MINQDPDNGVRYGILSTRNLIVDVLDELCYGPDAVDVDYEQAYKEAKKSAEYTFQAAYVDAKIAADETDHRMSEEEREDFIVDHLESTLGSSDERDYVDMCLEEFSDCYQRDESTIEGTYHGVKYLINYLGGNQILTVIKSDFRTKGNLCSPCIPGAVDLDSGSGDDYPYECYTVPNTWLQAEVAERAA